jgi:hypothetical protein
MPSAPDSVRESLHLTSGQSEILRINNRIILPGYPMVTALGMVEYARETGWLTDFRRAWKKDPLRVDYGILNGDGLVLRVEDFEPGLVYPSVYPNEVVRREARERTQGIFYQSFLGGSNLSDTVIYEYLSRPAARLLAA